eukprot:CAMPEP_0170110120 /NCGR_PEP_ID=MMETSP0020_2-20130122/7660_1 /TAXON_ID=98059 /ORGANISM="Dinobryon sp., Strain UTEXLB2267" /LENGTH=341 /DNA_ID=CAMNT_0010335337 /DNA_START=755 /DNA_END=1777 /DNA_ORIENTATION=-
MEIELRNLKEPQLLSVFSNYHHTTDDSFLVSLDSLLRPRASSILSLGDERESLTVLRRVTSLGTFERMPRTNSEAVAGELRHIPSTQSLHSHHSSGQNNSNSPLSNSAQVERPVSFSIYQPSTWLYLVTFLLSLIAGRLRIIFPTTRNDDFFYESIRIQPFSSGSYLRAMLVVGFSSMNFSIYHIVFWPELTSFVQPLQQLIIFWLYLSTFIQLVLHLIQLPLRLRVHFQCWESSRRVDVDGAINLLRRMLLSDDWLISRVINHILDFISITNLLVAEVYLWTTAKNIYKENDPLRELIISLCATNLMSLVVRIFIATIFSLSMHDPHVLNDARRRGLSKW